MKSLITYYLFAILIPILILAILIFNSFNIIFFIFLLFYALIYRPILDGIRLMKKGLLKKNEFWKLFVGYAHIRWFRKLYLEK